MNDHQGPWFKLRAVFFTALFSFTVPQTQARPRERPSCVTCLWRERAMRSILSRTCENTPNYLNDLQCFYPESLSPSILECLQETQSSYFSPKTYKEGFNANAQAQRTQSYIALLKMIRYASSQAVSVSSDLAKAFKLAAEKANCPTRGFSGLDFTEKWGTSLYWRSSSGRGFCPIMKS